MATKKQELQEEAKKLGIDFEEKTTIPQLEKLIQDKKSSLGDDKEAEETEEPTTDTEEQDTQEENTSEEEEEEDKEVLVLDVPKYKNNEEVEALKIETVVRKRQGGATLTPSEEGHEPFDVDVHFINKYNPRAGGYYVIHNDGTKSFSTAEAFEACHEEIEK